MAGPLTRKKRGRCRRKHGSRDANVGPQKGQVGNRIWGRLNRRGGARAFGRIKVGGRRVPPSKKMNEYVWGRDMCEHAWPQKYMGCICGVIPKLFLPSARALFSKLGAIGKKKWGPIGGRAKQCARIGEMGEPDFGVRCVADVCHLEMGLIAKVSAPQTRERPIWWRRKKKGVAALAKNWGRRRWGKRGRRDVQSDPRNDNSEIGFRGD